MLWSLNSSSCSCCLSRSWRRMVSRLSPYCSFSCLNCLVNYIDICNIIIQYFVTGLLLYSMVLRLLWWFSMCWHACSKNTINIPLSFNSFFHYQTLILNFVLIIIPNHVAYTPSNLQSDVVNEISNNNFYRKRFNVRILIVLCSSCLEKTVW